MAKEEEKEGRGDRSCRGVKGGIYRIAGIIFQKESKRGQTLSWWRGGSGKGVGAAEGWREKRAGCLAGRVGGGPCIDSQPLSSSLSPPCHGSREREREGGAGGAIEGGRIVVNP